MNNNETIESIAKLGIDLFQEATDQGLARKCLEEAVEACVAARIHSGNIEIVMLHAIRRAQDKGKDQVDKELSDNGFTGITGVSRHHFTSLRAQGMPHETAREMAVYLTVQQFDYGATVLRQRTWEKREDGSCQHQEQHQPTEADIRWIDEETT